MKASPIAYFNSNDGTGMFAYGESASIQLSRGINQVQAFIDEHEGNFLIGCVSYDVKNEIFDLQSMNKDAVNFPSLLFWKPSVVYSISEKGIHQVQGHRSKEAEVYLAAFLDKEQEKCAPLGSTFQATISKDEYLEKIKKIQDQIQYGNSYEVNFCQTFTAENCEIEDAEKLYFKLNSITKAPFSVYLSWNEFNVLCGSPERYIQKKGDQLLSQPIKGTAPRHTNVEMDEQLKTTLKNSQKERAENTMIVDLVRNDLARLAKKNSVKVPEFCTIYSFETVHQLISTVSCELKEKTTFTDCLKATFPMGSMTGAPKLRTMEIIEELEDFQRGLYAGSIGYIAPNGDFDFNVVIRSLLYNQTLKTASLSVGGAITIQSNPEEEYEECLVKIQRIMDGLNE